jgi:hypothetical protein
MRGKNIRLLPFIDKGIDLGRDEFLQVLRASSCSPVKSIT